MRHRLRNTFRWWDAARVAVLLLGLIATAILWGAWESHVANHIAEMTILQLYGKVCGEVGQASLPVNDARASALAHQVVPSFSYPGQRHLHRDLDDQHVDFLCHPRAWRSLPSQGREGSRIPGFLARQIKQTRGNDRKND